MATVDGLSKARMLAIEGASVVDGAVVGDDLILEKFNGSTINAGNVRGPQGVQGDPGTDGTDGTSYSPHTAGRISSVAQSAANASWTRLTSMVADSTYPTIGTKVSPQAGSIQVTETGLYMCLGGITFAANASNRRGIAFDSNASAGAAYANVQHAGVFSTSSSTPTITGFQFLYCNANDHIRMFAFQDSGGSLNFGGSSTTFFKVVKM